MQKILSRRSGPTTLFASLLAALVIGCGGGGGGGKTSTTGTSGFPTTTGTTTGTVPGATTGVTIAGDSSSGGSGKLIANALYFIELSEDAQSYSVKYTTEPAPGGGIVPPTTYATGLSLDSPVASPDPSASGQILYAAAPSGSQFGIYRGTNPASTTGAQTIVSSAYEGIDTIQVSRDGTKVVYIARPVGDTASHLYYALVNSDPASVPSAPVRLDGGEVLSAEISAGGSQVVYARVDSNGTSLYVRNFASSTSKPLISDGRDYGEPQYSKGGLERVVYSVGTSDSSRHIAEFITPAGSVGKIDPFPAGSEISMRSPTYNSDGTRIAFYADAPDSADSGIYTCDITGQNLVKAANGVLPPSIYWTTLTGRGLGGIALHLNGPHKR